MSTRLPYVVVCRENSVHFIGPFDKRWEADAHGSRMKEVRWHVVYMTPDEARAPVNRLSPTHDIAIREQEARLARAMRERAL
jgi:hypothetical protein